MAVKTGKTDAPSKEAVAAVLAFLAAWDPIGLAPGKDTPDDEYSPEAQDIAARLSGVRSGREAAALLSDVFERNFSRHLSEDLGYEETGKRFYREMAAKGFTAPAFAVIPGGKQGKVGGQEGDPATR